LSLLAFYPHHLSTLLSHMHSIFSSISHSCDSSHHACLVLLSRSSLSCSSLSHTPSLSPGIVTFLSPHFIFFLYSYKGSYLRNMGPYPRVVRRTPLFRVGTLLVHTCLTPSSFL
jgi:hypothetical protein